MWELEAAAPVIPGSVEGTLLVAPPWLGTYLSVLEECSFPRSMELFPSVVSVQPLPGSTHSLSYHQRPKKECET